MGRHLRPNYDVVKQLVLKHSEVSSVMRSASGIGIQVDVLDNLYLIDIAMDLVGFPPHEVLPRFPWYDLEYQDDRADTMTRLLFKDCNELKRKRPELFVKRPDRNK